MKANKEYRAEALKALEGEWSAPAIATLIVILIAISVMGILHVLFKDSAVASSTISNLASLFIFDPLGYCLAIATLKFFRTESKEVVKNMFDEFKNYGKIIGIVLLQFVYTFLWSLLLIIPGIIKSYSYAMAYFIKNDNPEISAEEAICRSMEIMKGKKWQLFCLDLSFLGWALLCILTLGIGFIWLVPYINTAHCAFYEDAKQTVLFVGEKEEEI